ncbi:DNA polymerase/3'-5' exonuclease PolX [Candidatus Woesearchaeota archaeon]|nr:DNA polymerase/3'-5' exonuclease PolX [Candidatus Woesearchaeota archaeon]
MKNQEIAKLLFDIAEMLELQNIPFKPRAYQRAARTIESLSENIEDIWKRGAILELPGIGESIAEKIVEYITTGKIKYYFDLKKKMPMDVEQLGKVPGLGPKRIKLLYDKLNVKTLADLKKAAQDHKIQRVASLGHKVEESILNGISFAQQQKGRALLGYVIPQVEELRQKLQAHPSVKKIEIAGSYRRKKETIGDIDVLIVSSQPQKVMDFFVQMNDVARVLAHGTSKSSVLLNNGMQVDVRVVKENEFGSALQYFTGNKEHNVELRKLALKKGLTLSEYGLFTLKDKKWVAGKTEEDIYKKLGVDIMPPEMRENMGEIDAGKRHTLPNLLDYGSCLGDFQVHTEWSDGQDTIEAMARAAEKLGRKFLVITDHVGQVGITNPLNEKKLEQQSKEISRVQKKVDIRIFHGAEVDILKDGRLALGKLWQKKLDVVLASVHLATKMDSVAMTKRICVALENNRVHILGHPTGRLLNRRDSYALDFGTLFDKVKKTETRLDIDCHPERMDLSSVHIKAAKEFGCRFAISTDSHSASELRNLHLGEALARRGWLEKKDVLNMYSVKEVETILGKK